MKRGKVTTVIGGQFGSEGKGVIVHYLRNRYKIHVRVGGPNAGHSFTDPKTGIIYKMQGIPVGWSNPSAVLVIGRGGLVNPEVLRREIDFIKEVDPNIEDRILIDARAGFLDEKFHLEEGGVHGEMHLKIGSTGEGIGAARVARLQRDPMNFQLIGQVAGQFGLQKMICTDTVSVINSYMNQGENVLLEGTQGFGLSLYHGPWPFCTSADTTAAQLCADAGISPMDVGSILMVIRTMPIRVAGNSGPLHKETDWREISQRLGRPIEERTTVTGKIRRIGEWDEELVRQAIRVNQPTSLALTFVDYLTPEDEGKTDLISLLPNTHRFISYLQQTFNVPISFIGTGGKGWQVVETGERI